MAKLSSKAPEVKKVLEAALLTASVPLPLNKLSLLFEQELSSETLQKILLDLAEDYRKRPIELLQVASGWRFRCRPEYMPYLTRLYPERTPKYNRVVQEVLAIIAYKQPVTRGDIEAIRGVSVATQTIRTLEERGWIHCVGRRETAGHPALWATTKQFLDDFNLKNLAELPLPATSPELKKSLQETIEAEETRL